MNPCFCKNCKRFKFQAEKKGRLKKNSLFPSAQNKRMQFIYIFSKRNSSKEKSRFMKKYCIESS